MKRYTSTHTQAWQQKAVRGQHHAPVALSPGTRVGTHCAGGGLGLGACLDGSGKSRRHRVRTPARPACSDSIYRLSYPGRGEHVITVFNEAGGSELFKVTVRAFSCRDWGELISWQRSEPYTSAVRRSVIATLPRPSLVDSFLYWLLSINSAISVLSLYPLYTFSSSLAITTVPQERNLKGVTCFGEYNSY